MDGRRGQFSFLLIIVFIVLFLLATALVTVVLQKGRTETPRPTPAERGPSVRVVPDKTTYASGERASFAVFIDSRGQSIIGIDLLLIFNTNEVEITEDGIAKSDIFPQFLGGFRRDFVDVNRQTGEGFIWISGLVAAVEEQAKAIRPEEPIVVIQGTVRKSGSILVDFTPGESADSNLTKAGEGKDILAWVEDAEFTVK